MENNDTLIDSYLTYLSKVLGYSQKTIISYGHDLRRLFEYSEKRKIQFCDFSHEDAKDFVSSLYEQKLSNSTISRIVSCQKGFFRYLCENNYARDQVFAHISGAKTKRILPTVLSEDEIKKLIAFEPKKYSELVELTMFNLFYSTGCRLSEIMNMKVGDIDFENRRILVTGKGTKQRFVFLSNRAVNTLKTYLVERKKTIESTVGKDPLYVLINSKGKRLPNSTVHSIFDKYRLKMGLTKKFTPHVFRHTFATHLLDNDSDIRLVQELLGHESIGTTQIYTHVSRKHLTEVYKKTHPHGQNVQKEKK